MQKNLQVFLLVRKTKGEVSVVNPGTFLSKGGCAPLYRETAAAIVGKTVGGTVGCCCRQKKIAYNEGYSEPATYFCPIPKDKAARKTHVHRTKRFRNGAG